MRAIIERDYAASIYRIYLLVDQGPQTHALIIDQDGQRNYVPVEWGAKAPPFMILDYEAYEAIMREALGPTPTDDVLWDTRNMRDRLLTMVESEWKSRQLEVK